MLHFGKFPKKNGEIWRKFSKIWPNLGKFAKFWKKTAKNSAIFNENFEIRERLRSWLSVSSPHRSVGTLPLLPRGSFVYQTRRKPCTLSISLGIVAQLSDKWKPEYRHLGIFILYSRDLSLQPPFAEVLSGLLRAA